MSELLEEYEALTQFLYMAPVGLAQTAMDGQIALINPVSAQLLMPLSRDGSLSNLFEALQDVAPDLRARVNGFGMSHGMVCEAMRLQVAAGVRGKSDPRVLSLTLLKLDETRLMAVLSDVSQQIKRERLLEHNEAWLSAIMTGITNYAIVSLDADGLVDDWNESIARVTGFTREAVLGQAYSIFYPQNATTQERVLDRLRDADGQGWSIDDGWRVRADGSQFWGTAMIVPLRNRDAPEDARPDKLAGLAEATPPTGAPRDASYCLVIRDITDKREASEKLRQASSCDHLTGIANRRAFFDAAELELDRWRRSPRPMSLILFDVDHFKRVNDTYGHPAGDAVLRRLAEILTNTFRQVDVVARIGGEEFAVLLPSTDLTGARIVADRLRQAVELSSVTTDGSCIHLTVSGGVATMEPGVPGIDALLKRADQRLYAAKTAGRNRIVWELPD